MLNSTPIQADPFYRASLLLLEAAELASIGSDQLQPMLHPSDDAANWPDLADLIYQAREMALKHSEQLTYKRSCAQASQLQSSAA